MTAAKYNMNIEQGADFVKSFQWLTNIPSNLLTSTVSMVARDLVETTKYIDIDSNTSSISVTTDSFTITLPSATTAAYTFTDAVYNIEVTSPSSIVTRLLEGTVSLSLDVD